MIPVRFFRYKESGGKFEVLVEKILDINKILVKIKNAKNINIGTNIFFGHKKIGSIAAPTTGLHFDLPLLDTLYNKGVDINYITLHIGSGTFQPIRTVKIKEHIMHSELVEFSSLVIKKIKSCRKKGIVLLPGVPEHFVLEKVLIIHLNGTKLKLH